MHKSKFSGAAYKAEWTHEQGFAFLITNRDALAPMQVRGYLIKYHSQCINVDAAYGRPLLEELNISSLCFSWGKFPYHYSIMESTNPTRGCIIGLSLITANIGVRTYAGYD